jgi:hypothetical protein
MKNIHVLPTDKPSRLQLQMNGKYHLENGQTISLKKYQNIYITSDEEIKDGDYYLYLKDNKVYQFIRRAHTKLLRLDIQKKIILTTDVDLIKDGVQDIDDEFLEWFVKNPSCEFVEVKTDECPWFVNGGKQIEYREYTYIEIPKEEPKQEPGKETADYIDRHIVEALVEVAKQKMYSEEDMKSSFQVGFNVGYNDEESPSYLTFEEWIKEYKKK